MNISTGLMSTIGLGLFLTISSIGGCMKYYPVYTVYQQEMVGKAELAKADQNKQIIVTNAKARLEAAKLEGDAEVARAEGAAKANEKLIKSLGTPENYLSWRYIMMLENNEAKGVQREIIYIRLLVVNFQLLRQVEL